MLRLVARRCHRRVGRDQRQIARDLADRVRVERRLLAAVAEQQRAVAHHVDQAGHAARHAVELRERLVLEQRLAGVAGEPQPLLDVVVHLLFREGTQRVAQHDALAQLAQLGLRQLLGQLGLPDQHDLEQLRAGRLEVREQPDLLEHLGGEVLRLVHDQQRRQVSPEALDQEAVQREQVLGLGAADLLDAELVEQHAEEVERLEARVEDEGGRGLAVELREQRVQQRGLARADLAGEQHEALAGAHRVDEGRQPFAMGVPEDQEGRIRGHLEGAANEPVVLVVHAVPRLPPAARGRRRGRRRRRPARRAARPGAPGGRAARSRSSCRRATRPAPARPRPRLRSPAARAACGRTAGRTRAPPEAPRRAPGCRAGSAASARHGTTGP